MNSCRPRSTARNGGRRAVTTGKPLREERRAQLAEQDRGRHAGSAAIPACNTTAHPEMAHLQRHRRQIHSTNPCSEYVFLNNTACNLASLNLMKFKARGRQLRCRTVQSRRAHFHHRAGNSRGQRQLSDQGNRGEFAHLPHARPRLRQPRLAHHELRLAVTIPTKAARSPAPSPPS